MIFPSNGKQPYISVSAFACPERNRVDCLMKYNWDNVDAIHIDIMDGICVPLKGLQISEVEAINKSIAIPIDLHLMVVNQRKYLQRLLGLSNLHVVIVTIENFTKELIRELLREIKNAGKIPGIAIWPNTDISKILDFAILCEVLLVMSTEAGVSQSLYIENTVHRIQQIQKILPSNIALWVDGGMNRNRAMELQGVGAEGFVFGRTFFDSLQTPGILSIKGNY